MSKEKELEVVIIEQPGGLSKTQFDLFCGSLVPDVMTMIERIEQDPAEKQKYIDYFFKTRGTPPLRYPDAKPSWGVQPCKN